MTCLFRLLFFLLLPSFSSANCKGWCETAAASWGEKCWWQNCNACDECCLELGWDSCNPSTSPTTAPTTVPTIAPTTYPTRNCTSVEDCFGLTESWRDDFDSFDTQSWTKGLWGSWNKNTGGPGLLNNKYAGWIRDEDSYVENGSLFLANTNTVVNGTTGEGDRTFNYTSGWINSKHKRFWNGTARSAYLDIRAKFPAGPKTWPAIWMVANGGGWPPEIDIWEYFGVFFDPSYGCIDCMYLRNIHGKVYYEAEDFNIILEDFHSKYRTAETDFHQYGWLWTDSVMAWYIDDRKVGEMVIDVDVSAEDWPKEDMMLILNNGLLSSITTEKYPELDETTFPNYVVIDSLVLYEDPSPPAPAPTSEPDSSQEDSTSDSSLSTASSTILAIGIVGGLAVLGAGVSAYKTISSSQKFAEDPLDLIVNPISEKTSSTMSTITNSEL